MYSLDVASPCIDRALVVKAAPYLRLDRSTLRAGPGKTAVADFNDYIWVFGQNYSTEIDIITPCAIHFENGGNEPVRYGPFPEVHIVGPSLFVGPGFTTVLARYDREKHQWLACCEGKYYDAVLIESV